MLSAESIWPDGNAIPSGGASPPSSMSRLTPPRRSSPENFAASSYAVRFSSSAPMSVRAATSVLASAVRMPARLARPEGAM